MPGILFVTATPIGNLEDITLRALRTLNEVDYIACEDTRVTKRICDKYDIKKPLVSYHAHSGETKLEKIVSLLQEGKKVALVSDAGTPAVSDPGAGLVRSIINYNSNVEENNQIIIESIPGPSALTTALSLAGIERTAFSFLGFVPHKKGRQTFFKNIALKVDNEEVVIFFESTHRFVKTLESLIEYSPHATVIIARELTKIHEQIKEGTPKESLDYYLLHTEQQKGEFVIIVR